MLAFIRKELTAGITPLHLNGFLLVSSYSPIYTVPRVRKPNQKHHYFKAPLGFSAAFSRQGFEVNKTIHATQETQHNVKGISITNKSRDRKWVKLGYREKR